jgi:hypothetical protein
MTSDIYYFMLIFSLFIPPLTETAIAQDEELGG